MAVLGETRSWSPKPWEFRRYNCDFHPKCEVNESHLLAKWLSNRMAMLDCYLLSAYLSNALNS